MFAASTGGVSVAKGEQAMKERRKRQLEQRELKRKMYSMDLEPPLRFAVKHASGKVTIFTHRNLAEPEQDKLIASIAMGTHESLGHAAKRAGWQ